jgi:hypothetical protein
MASVRPGPFQDFYTAALAKGIKPTMARLTLARKIAAIPLTLWSTYSLSGGRRLARQRASSTRLTPYNRRACSVSKPIGGVATEEDATGEMEQPKATAGTTPD